MAAKRSTNACAGAFDACASSTSVMIRASVVSCAGFVARTSSVPSPLTLPAKTAMPGCTSAGIDSPVIGA